MGGGAQKGCALAGLAPKWRPFCFQKPGKILIAATISGSNLNRVPPGDEFGSLAGGRSLSGERRSKEMPLHHHPHRSGFLFPEKGSQGRHVFISHMEGADVFGRHDLPLPLSALKKIPPIFRMYSCPCVNWDAYCLRLSQTGAFEK